MLFRSVNFHSYLSNKGDLGSLFRRSYAISASDIKSLLSKHIDADMIRIYPALDKDKRGKFMLTFVLMAQNHDGKMLWDVESPQNEAQIDIQDQFEPCPDDCGHNELLTEEEWNKITKRIQ